MFKKENDDYLNATRHAQVNTSASKNLSKKIWITVNVLSASVLFYFVFDYIKNETTLLGSAETSKRAVLGVSETVSNHGLTDKELMNILKMTDYSKDVESSKQTNTEAPANSMKVLINEPSIQSQTSYSEEIARELDDKDDYKGRLVVVKQGDTLSSLAERFYGNSMNFSKIIDNNPTLSENVNSLEVGQVLNVPY